MLYFTSFLKFIVSSAFSNLLNITIRLYPTACNVILFSLSFLSVLIMWLMWNCSFSAPFGGSAVCPLS